MTVTHRLSLTYVYRNDTGGGEVRLPRISTFDSCFVVPDDHASQQTLLLTSKIVTVWILVQNGKGSGVAGR